MNITDLHDGQAVCKIKAYCSVILTMCDKQPSALVIVELFTTITKLLGIIYEAIQLVLI